MTEDGLKMWRDGIAELMKKQPANAKTTDESASAPADAPFPATEPLPSAPEPDRVFKLHEIVMARNEDRKLHPAEVLRVMNPQAADKRRYIVKFLDSKIDKRLELPSKDVKINFQEERKKAEKLKAQKEAEEAERARAAGIITGAAALKPEFQQREPSKVGDGPPKSQTMKSRKLENSRTYKERANNWKTFQKSKVFKKTKKESMFRTVEGNTNARGKQLPTNSSLLRPFANSFSVGVIGSGRGMTKDQVRVKPVKWDKTDTKTEP
jgi:hypothetical protein